MACDGALQEKNVSNEMLDGKVGRMYVPRQEIGSIATRKMKVSQPLTTQGKITAVHRPVCNARWC